MKKFMKNQKSHTITPTGAYHWRNPVTKKHCDRCDGPYHVNPFGEESYTIPGRNVVLLFDRSGNIHRTDGTGTWSLL